MGGSSGSFGNAGSGRTAADIAAKLRQEAEISSREFETELADEFATLLAGFNSRDTQETAERLTNIKALLSDEIDLESSFDTLFGGSVAKHTYVDGISDVDAMLVVKGDLETVRPQDVISKVAAVLVKKLDASCNVTLGNVAITVTYKNGPEIQLVPSVLAAGKMKVPAWEGNQWSSIDPQQFKDGLTKRNQECAGKLIPTLKLAKAINATLPIDARLSGYHLESIGVAAFRGYNDDRTTVRMLPHFFKKASELVLSPMLDRTGQSVHVDSYLGEANSTARIAASHLLGRMHQRMVNASASKSRDRWRDLFDE